MRTIPADQLRGNPDVIAWFHEHGHDPHTIAARRSDELVVDDDGTVHCRRYPSGPTGGRLFRGDELVTEPLSIAARRPFPVQP